MSLYACIIETYHLGIHIGCPQSWIWCSQRKQLKFLPRPHCHPQISALHPGSPLTVCRSSGTPPEDITQMSPTVRTFAKELSRLDSSRTLISWTLQCTTSHLLHEDLGVIGDHISIHHWSKCDVVTGRLDILINQLPVAFPSQTVYQICSVTVAAAHLLGQDLGVHQRPVVH